MPRDGPRRVEKALIKKRSLYLNPATARRDGEKGIKMSHQFSQAVTVPSLIAKKQAGEKIVSATAYDFPTAELMDRAGVDLILVGDSLGMVVLGYANTTPVTMEEMLHHTRPVALAAERSLVVADMPYFSYHVSVEETIRNASRFIKEAGAKAVKVEGASKKRLKLVESMIDAEIPVMGHVGLTPQSIYRLGQFRVRGGELEEARQIIQDALNLEKAGAFSIVLECIPQEVAAIITEKLHIPTIGIGAGPHCDGQILVFHDMVGLTSGSMPKFVKKYADLQAVLGEAIGRYRDEVRRGDFPDDSHAYHLKAGVIDELRGRRRRKPAPASADSQDDARTKVCGS